MGARAGTPRRKANPRDIDPVPAPSESKVTEDGFALITDIVSVWAEREKRARLIRSRKGIPEPDRYIGFSDPEVFELARRLKAAGVDSPELLEARPVFDNLCRSLGVNPDDLMGRLCSFLRRVETTPETDALSAAMREADRMAPAFRDPHWPAYYARLTALAFALSRAQPGQFFPLPVYRIAPWLGVHRTTVGLAIRELDDRGIIHLRRSADGKPSWNHKTGEARLAKYTGPKPPGED